MQDQGNDIMRPRIPYKCGMMKDLKQYCVNNESPEMAYWSMLGKKFKYVENDMHTVACYS